MGLKSRVACHLYDLGPVASPAGSLAYLKNEPVEVRWHSEALSSICGTVLSVLSLSALFPVPGSAKSARLLLG